VTHTSASAVFCADYSIDSVATSDSGTYVHMYCDRPIGSDNTTITVVVDSIKMYHKISVVMLLI